MKSILISLSILTALLLGCHKADQYKAYCRHGKITVIKCTDTYCETVFSHKCECGNACNCVNVEIVRQNGSVTAVCHDCCKK